MKTFYHVTPVTNLYWIFELGLIPQVGERSKLLNEEPGVFLFPTYEDCETALSGWLGDEFDEYDDQPYIYVCTLEINLPIDFSIENDLNIDWEVISRKIILPEYIRFYKYEG